VAKAVFSNNTELLRHLSAPPIRRLGLEVEVCSSGAEILDAVSRSDPHVAMLDAELPEISGYEVARRIKASHPECRVVLVMGRRLSAPQMQRVAESGCDEVIIVPVTGDQLYDVIALQLGLPRRGSERYGIDLAVVTHDGERSIDGRVSNLSVDGARLVLPEKVEEGTELRLTITADDVEAEPLEIRAKIVWSQPREDSTVVGASFEDVSAAVQARLSRLTQWEIVEDTERTRVVIKGDITEATSFRDLMPAMVGRVDFDMSQVRYMNSLGVREWVTFLRDIPVQGYEFHACSIPFVLQASMVKAVLGRGSVTSFFAPYHCEDCDLQEERLLQSATILAAEDLEPPTFTCPSCAGPLVLDDIAERYFAFLSDPGD
jgi:DNA-binding response OmpR family regulator